MTFPEKGAYRGLPSPDCIDNKSSIVATAAFQFDNGKKERPDKRECSVFWADDDDALTLLALQNTCDKKGNSRPQFRSGACLISLENLQSVKGKYKDVFDFERAPIAGSQDLQPNPYHGNLLVDVSANRSLRHQISSVLAYYSKAVANRQDLDALM